MTDENIETTNDLEQDATEILMAELEQLKSENAALKEQALRYAAEAENEATNAVSFRISSSQSFSVGITRLVTSTCTPASRSPTW